ncbi:hypothetical protein BDN72DRAFT_608956 [Pluteus cervinus]|uniref:Uncharacterized protein n=1 Tax=Pluteus cervinus TaxID=181527 RepID=A0ACD3A0V4_9AGAR|nr:hypothetical protein BDN72DRAFT_608956 [Pluteus cervinus]
MTLLPVELVSLILDHAAQSYSPTELAASFTSFSLVSRDWNAFAQPVLFSRFTRYKQHYTSSPLIKTLLSHHNLRPHAKALWIDGHWYHSETETKLLFALLPQMLELGIWHSGYTKLLSSSTLNDAVMASGNLTSLCLQSLEDFPIDLFDHWVSLEELYVRNTVMAGFSRFTGEPTTISQSTTGHRPRLRRLQLEIYRLDERSTLAWLAHPQCIFDLTLIRTFHLNSHLSHVADNYDEIARDLMSICAPSIEDLVVAAPSTSEQNGPLLSSSRTSVACELQRVRVLRFRFLEQGSIVEKVAVVSWITAFLSVLAQPGILEEIWIPGLLPHNHLELGQMTEAYTGFTALLTSLPFKKLQRIWIAYHEPHQKLSKDEAGQIFRQVLPGLYSTGRISIQITFPQYGRYVMRDSETWHYGLLN